MDMMDIKEAMVGTGETVVNQEIQIKGRMKN